MIDVVVPGEETIVDEGFDHEEGLASSFGTLPDDLIDDDQASEDLPERLNAQRTRAAIHRAIKHFSNQIDDDDDPLKIEKLAGTSKPKKFRYYNYQEIASGSQHSAPEMPFKLRKFENKHPHLAPVGKAIWEWYTQNPDEDFLDLRSFLIEHPTLDFLDVSEAVRRLTEAGQIRDVYRLELEGHGLVRATYYAPRDIPPEIQRLGTVIPGIQFVERSLAQR